MLYGHRILAYCTTKIYEDRFYSFIEHLNDELLKYNWRIMVFCTESDLYKDNKNNQGEKNIFDLINYDILDAMLISDDHILDAKVKENIINKSKTHNIPVFILNNKIDGCYNINFNQERGFERICRHVIEYHRVSDLHFIAGTKGSFESEERINVFKKVLRDNDLIFDDSMLSYGDFWDMPTKAAVEKLIEEDRVPKAIICANDTMAIAVTATLKDHGYYCPEDVIVTGFDGITSIFYATPKITSVLCDLKRLGKETALIIQKVMEEHLSPFSTLIEPTMYVSESCGCIARRPANTLNFLNQIKGSYSRYRSENTSLSNMSVSIQDCKDIREVIQQLKNELLYNVMFLVKSECIDSSVNPAVSQTATTYGDKMYLLADSDYQQEIKERFIDTKDLLPRMEEILTLYNHPLFFTPVNNTDLPLGYLCFFFNNYDQQNYAKVAQIASWMGNAIAGYRNSQYLRYLQTKLEDMYRYDPLTGLYNRNGFVNIFNRIMSDSLVTTLTMVMCDLDNLKTINDNFSHNEGDNSINIVGQALSKAVAGGFYCRYGGDEIIGLYTAEIDAEVIKNRIAGYLREYNSTSGKPYQISTSVGVYSSKKTSFDKLFAEADKLMYQEKMAKKKNRK